jgi:alkylated DNA repair protein (DNA oxidative demethylase)
VKNHTLELFPPAAPDTRHEPLEPGAWLLRGFALAVQMPLLAAIDRIAAIAPFRHLETPGGFRMSVGMTNCGTLGWVSDRTGYRYDPCDPLSGRPWAAMPRVFLDLARSAADVAGVSDLEPDASLVNRYEPGSRLTLHQDRNERGYSDPIVSVSLGLPAVFLFGGDSRSDKQRRIPLQHGDVVVWGGPARMRYHGVLPLKEGHHEATGSQRLNLTFRRAG